MINQLSVETDAWPWMAATSVRRSLEMPTPFAVLPPAVLSPDLAPSARASQPIAMARRHTRMLSAAVRVRPHLDGAGDMRRALNNVHAHNMRKRHRWAILIAKHGRSTLAGTRRARHHRQPEIVGIELNFAAPSEIFGRRPRRWSRGGASSTARPPSAPYPPSGSRPPSPDTFTAASEG